MPCPRPAWLVGKRQIGNNRHKYSALRRIYDLKLNVDWRSHSSACLRGHAGLQRGDIRNANDGKVATSSTPSRITPPDGILPKAHSVSANCGTPPLAAVASTRLESPPRHRRSLSTAANSSDDHGIHELCIQMYVTSDICMFG
jgi:hypothetical protein